jgi:hypothetical protein
MAITKWWVLRRVARIMSAKGTKLTSGHVRADIRFEGRADIETGIVLEGLTSTSDFHYWDIGLIT